MESLSPSILALQHSPIQSSAPKRDKFIEETKAHQTVPALGHSRSTLVVSIMTVIIPANQGRNSHKPTTAFGIRPVTTSSELGIIGTSSDPVSETLDSLRFLELYPDLLGAESPLSELKNET